MASPPTGSGSQAACAPVAPPSRPDSPIRARANDPQASDHALFPRGARATCCRRSWLRSWRRGERAILAWARPLLPGAMVPMPRPQGATGGVRLVVGGRIRAEPPCAATKGEHATEVATAISRRPAVALLVCHCRLPARAPQHAATPAPKLNPVADATFPPSAQLTSLASNPASVTLIRRLLAAHLGQQVAVLAPERAQVVQASCRRGSCRGRGRHARGPGRAPRRPL